MVCLHALTTMVCSISFNSAGVLAPTRPLAFLQPHWFQLAFSGAGGAVVFSCCYMAMGCRPLRLLAPRHCQPLADRAASSSNRRSETLRLWTATLGHRMRCKPHGPVCSIVTLGFIQKSTDVPCELSVSPWSPVTPRTACTTLRQRHRRCGCEKGSRPGGPPSCTRSGCVKPSIIIHTK
jgi:hypothetical protein